MLFVQEEAGQLFRDIALAISAAVGLSMIVSITVIPTAAAAILKDRPGEALAAAAAVPGTHPSHGPTNGDGPDQRRRSVREPARAADPAGRSARGPRRWLRRSAGSSAT